MKKSVKLLSLLLILVLSTTCFVGCGAGGNQSNKVKEGQTEINIAFWNSGTGVEWLNNLIEAFEKKYPEYVVSHVDSGSTDAVRATYGKPDIDTYDLYMCGKGVYNTTYAEPLDDLLDRTAEGDATTLREKFNEDYLLYEKATDGKVYSLTYGGGVLGFVYNKDMFEKAGVDTLPRTTDEFTAICDLLYSKGYTPLAHFQDGGYYNYLDQAFMVQYSGTDYVLNRFWLSTDENGKSPSKDVFKEKDGRYYGLKACEKFLTPEYTLLGSNTKSHTEIQTEFLMGKAAMMFNGSWMMNEMKNIDSVVEIGEMKPLVLSAMIDKLNTVKNDKLLRAVITAVDQVADGEKQLSDFASGDEYVVDGQTISKEDWERISSARYTVPANYAGQSAWIPNYSEDKEAAKKFLEFMYSDAGYKIMVETNQMALPMKYSDGSEIDTTGWTEFEKFQAEILDSATGIASPFYSGRHRIFTDGGATYLAGVNYVEKFTAQNKADRMTANQVWDFITQKVDDNFENIWLKNIK